MNDEFLNSKIHESIDLLKSGMNLSQVKAKLVFDGIDVEVASKIAKTGMKQKLNLEGKKQIILGLFWIVFFIALSYLTYILSNGYRFYWFLGGVVYGIVQIMYGISKRSTFNNDSFN